MKIRRKKCQFYPNELILSNNILIKMAAAYKVYMFIRLRNNTKYLKVCSRKRKLLCSEQLPFSNFI